ncbi:MAG: type II toxin-antitoxin system VapC family toxin, partial [Candidatus Rokuibacteriota bacterium]
VRGRLMRLLLDTQIFLWYLDRTARIPGIVRQAIDDTDNAVLVSAAVIWEISIKTSRGRLEIPTADLRRLTRLIEATGFEELPVLARHAAGVHGLPWHHRDPFDRLMIAQARDESLTLVTVDPAIRAYDVSVL